MRGERCAEEGERGDGGADVADFVGLDARLLLAFEDAAIDQRAVQPVVAWRVFAVDACVVEYLAHGDAPELLRAPSLPDTAGTSTKPSGVRTGNRRRGMALPAAQPERAVGERRAQLEANFGVMRVSSSLMLFLSKMLVYGYLCYTRICCCQMLTLG